MPKTLADVEYALTISACTRIEMHIMCPHIIYDVTTKCKKHMPEYIQMLYKLFTDYCTRYSKFYIAL